MDTPVATATMQDPSSTAAPKVTRCRVSEAVPGCTGRCCAVFSMAPEALLHYGSTGNPEHLFVLDMLRSLAPEDIGSWLDECGFAEKATFGARYGQWAHSTEGGHGTRWLAFTCRHWDSQSRLCTVYDRRPAMCRNYPNGETCQGCGCAGGLPDAAEIK